VGVGTLRENDGRGYGGENADSAGVGRGRNPQRRGARVHYWPPSVIPPARPVHAIIRRTEVRNSRFVARSPLRPRPLGCKMYLPALTRAARTPQGRCSEGATPTGPPGPLEEDNTGQDGAPGAVGGVPGTQGATPDRGPGRGGDHATGHAGARDDITIVPGLATPRNHPRVDYRPPPLPPPDRPPPEWLPPPDRPLTPRRPPPLVRPCPPRPRAGEA
jgi:hypothetical protein